jgi:hypothetical protein
VWPWRAPVPHGAKFDCACAEPRLFLDLPRDALAGRLVDVGPAARQRPVPAVAFADHQYAISLLPRLLDRRARRRRYLPSRVRPGHRAERQSTTASRCHMRVGATADEPHFPRHQRARAISAAASCETRVGVRSRRRREPRRQSAKHHARRASDAPCRIRFAPTAASPISPPWPLLQLQRPGRRLHDIAIQ